ncbi:MAG: protein kinase domain-containing protein, partial [Acidobacteriaceae bacterium]
MAVQTLGHVARLGHYRLLEQIGSGGMGVVYRAWDEHLDRDVAVKVLSPHLLVDENVRKRFRKEARSLSKVNHPNIATIHDFATQDDLDYLVMEFVPGKTLRDRISDGPVPETEVTNLASQLAHGLAAAHERGLVHRDLKPENIRLTLDGRLKILDFGLAKLVRQRTDLLTTEANITAVVGTLPYMAPEQLVGGTVEARSDLFSFGVVLYEMATGQRPFVEADPSRLIAAILHKSPVPASGLNPNVSAATDRVISKCLEKNPANRYQSAQELAADLSGMTPGSTVSHPTRLFWRLSRWPVRNTALVLGLAVLLAATGLLLRSRTTHALSGADTLVIAEFVNSTSDPVFDDALSQALAVELEQSPFLKILPPAKMRETLILMGRSPDASITPEIGREVCQRADGTAVLWGSIASLGSHYVIELTAAECSTGSDLAVEQIEAPNKEAVLNSLARAASDLRRKLGESFSSVERFDKPLEQATTPSLDALKAYSLGRKTEYQKGTSAAIPLFKRAIELDPKFAVAYAALGIGYSNLGEPGLANQNFRRAYDLRNRVSEREKLRISAYYHSYCTGDLLKGNEIYEQWAQTYPRDGVPFGNMGVTNFYMGKYEKAIADTLEHLRLEPDDVMGYGNLVVQYTALNRLGEAKSAYQDAMERKLEEAGLHANRYGVAFLEGDEAEMERQIR